MNPAPGKLFIAGEYAVVEPGGRAVLVAIDRYVTVRVSPSEHRGMVRSAHFGREPLHWLRDDRGVVVPEDGRRPLDYVFSAIRTIEALVADLGIEPQWYTLDISSDLDDGDGRKYGLGSSAAVTVGVVGALNEFYGLRLTGLEQFKAALLAAIDVAPSSSGGDIAASTFGGWLAYQSPDRTAATALRDRDGTLAAIRRPWPLLEISPLPTPTGLDLIVGWTGAAASTTALVDDVRARRDIANPSYARFLAESRTRVDELVAGLREANPALVLGAVRATRELLAGLGTTLGIPIETPALTTLARSAEQIGAAGKPSGAGGGDCGIVLAVRGADLDPMLREWERAGLRPLSLAVAPQVSAVAAQ
ncbi:MAG TPA: phosphomevalonate kinase [Beutenbergiaceae bacterium]|nr:phosphomevalonate kinase [Beutenbergiaceae bacterium]